MDDYKQYKNLNNNLELQEKSYETLEFLGDSILGSIVSSYLYRRYQQIYYQNEGFLTKMKNNIVNGESLSKLSSCLNLNKYMIISEYIESKCQRNNMNILEDIFEAFIGAIYLDTNYNTTEKVLIRIIEKFIDFGELIITDTNYKDQLLRYYQNNYKESPKYDNEYNEGKKLYISKLKNNKFNKDIFGNGNSKKKSEQDLARNVLIQFGVLN